MNVGVGLHVYHSTRSNKSDLNVSISYDKVFDIMEDIVVNVIEKSKEHDDVFAPSSFVNIEPTFFANANTD